LLQDEEKDVIDEQEDQAAAFEFTDSANPIRATVTTRVHPPLVAGSSITPSGAA
jgi:hypothetical protein